MAEKNYRKTLIKLVTFLGGIYFFIEFILPSNLLEKTGLDQYHSNITAGFIVVSTMAVGLGIINLFMVHGSRLAFRRKNWFYSLVLLSGLIFMLFVTVSDWRANDALVKRSTELLSLRDYATHITEGVGYLSSGRVPEKSSRIEKLVESGKERLSRAEKHIAIMSKNVRPKLKESDVLIFDSALDSFKVHLKVFNEGLTLASSIEDSKVISIGNSLADAGLAYQKLLRLEYDLMTIKRLWIFLYEGLFVSLESAMFSLLGVYIAAAAYRAFRIKTFESALMMIAAALVMLGQIPFYQYISADLPNIRQWLLEVPSSAAFRAIKIGAAIAGLVMAFRMWLSIESEDFAKSKVGGK